MIPPLYILIIVKKSTGDYLFFLKTVLKNWGDGNFW